MWDGLKVTVLTCWCCSSGIEVDQYLFAVEVGDKEQAVLVVPEANPVFEPSVRFAIDGLTEKVCFNILYLKTSS